MRIDQWQDLLQFDLSSIKLSLLCLDLGKLEYLLLNLLAVFGMLLLQTLIELELLALIVEFLHLCPDNDLLFLGQNSEGQCKAWLNLLFRDLLHVLVDDTQAVVVLNQEDELLECCVEHFRECGSWLILILLDFLEILLQLSEFTLQALELRYVGDV